MDAAPANNPLFAAAANDDDDVSGGSMVKFCLKGASVYLWLARVDFRLNGSKLCDKLLDLVLAFFGGYTCNMHEVNKSSSEMLQNICKPNNLKHLKNRISSYGTQATTSQISQLPDRNDPLCSQSWHNLRWTSRFLWPNIITIQILLFSHPCISLYPSVSWLQNCQYLSLIHIWRCRRIERCRSRWSPYH